MKRSSIILAVVGVILIVVAAVVRFAIVPNASKLPGDTDLTSDYAGTISMLDSKTLATGDVAKAFITDAPVTMKRHVFVASSDSDTAVVHDDSTVMLGDQKLPDNHVYALNRTDMTPAPAPEGSGAEKTEGITVTLPVGPKGDNSYQLYDPATQTANPLKYVGDGERDGRSVYHFTSVGDGPVKAAALAAMLPKSLPSSLAPQLLPKIKPETRKVLAAAGPLPAQIPLTYTVKTTYEIWGDKQLGVPLAVAIHRIVTANAALGPQPLELMPVLDLNVKTTDAAVKSSADDAASTGRLLSIMKIWVPIVLLVLGIALIAFAVVRGGARRSAGTSGTGT